MQKLLITGGAGFIGSHAAEYFRDDYEVHIVDNLISGFAHNVPTWATWHQMDIRSEACAELIQAERFDIVLHLAAQISVNKSIEDPRTDVDINVRGLMNILEALPKDHLPHFLFSSTGGAIYGLDVDLPACENALAAPASVYGTSKLVSEKYIELWGRLYGLHYSIFRLANIYGPRQSAAWESGVIGQFISRALKREEIKIFGTGEQTRDYTFVRDVVQAFAAAIGHKAKGIYNIGTTRETSVNEVFAQVRAVHGPNLNANYYPAKPGEVLRSCLQTAHAQEAFGWQSTTPLAQGIKMTYDWYQTQFLA